MLSIATTIHKSCMKITYINRCPPGPKLIKPASYGYNSGLKGRLLHSFREDYTKINRCLYSESALNLLFHIHIDLQFYNLRLGEEKITRLAYNVLIYINSHYTIAMVSYGLELQFLLRQSQSIVTYRPMCVLQIGAMGSSIQPVLPTHFLSTPSPNNAYLTIPLTMPSRALIILYQI